MFYKFCRNPDIHTVDASNSALLKTHCILSKNLALGNSMGSVQIVKNIHIDRYSTSIKSEENKLNQIKMGKNKESLGVFK